MRVEVHRDDVHHDEHAATPVMTPQKMKSPQRRLRVLMERVLSGQSERPGQPV